MEIKEKIETLIKENNVCLFMKGTPDSSMWFFNGCIKCFKAFKCKF